MHITRSPSGPAAGMFPSLEFYLSVHLVFSRVTRKYEQLYLLCSFFIIYAFTQFSFDVLFFFFIDL